MERAEKAVKESSLWKEEARMYCGNSDHHREKREQAEYRADSLAVILDREKGRDQ